MTTTWLFQKGYTALELLPLGRKCISISQLLPAVCPRYLQVLHFFSLLLGTTFTSFPPTNHSSKSEGIQAVSGCVPTYTRYARSLAQQWGRRSSRAGVEPFRSGCPVSPLPSSPMKSSASFSLAGMQRGSSCFCAGSGIL